MAKNSSNELRKYLLSLETGTKPTLHINGPSFYSAVLTVDFGTPLKPTKLTPEQSQDLTQRMRKLTRELIGNRDVNIRINSDYHHGVYWASLY